MIWRLPTLTRLHAVYAAAFATMALVVPYLSWTLSREGLDAQQIGDVGSALTLAAVVTAPLWGALDDRSGGWGLRVALLVSGVSAAWLASVAGHPGVALLAAAASFGAASGALESLTTAATFAYLGEGAPIGRIRRAGSGGWVVGLAAAAGLAALDPAASIWAAALLATGAAVVPPLRARPARHRQLRVRSVTSPIVLLLVSTIAMPVGLFTVTIFTGAFIERVEGPAWQVAGPLILMALLEIPALAAAQRACSRHGPRALLVAAHGAFALAFMLLAATPTFEVLVLVQPLLAIGFASWFVGQATIIARLAGQRHGYGQTLASVATKGVAGVLVGAIGGRLIATGGFGLFFAVVGVLCVTGALVSPLVLTFGPVRSRLKEEGTDDPANGGVT